MIDINQAAESVISGCAVSCGAFLVVAGASKLYRSIRTREDMTAIRRALRMPRRRWRLFWLAAGGVECVTGLLVCSGAYPVFGGAWPGRPRRRVLRSARIRARQADSWWLRLCQMAHRTRSGRSGDLAGDGPRRSATRRRHRVYAGRCERASGALVRRRGCRQRNRPGAAEHAHAGTHSRLPQAAVAPDPHHAARTDQPSDVRGDGCLSRTFRARGPVSPDRMHGRILVYGGNWFRGSRVPGPSAGARRPAGRTHVTAGHPDTGNELADPGHRRG